jgi:hypothetical protein
MRVAVVRLLRHRLFPGPQLNKPAAQNSFSGSRLSQGQKGQKTSVFNPKAAAPLLVFPLFSTD